VCGLSTPMTSAFTRLSLLFVVLLIPFRTAFPQQPQSTPPTEPKETDVVRISVRLVQVDGTVIDKKGRQVTDLTRDDFQLFVDGVLKPITTFYYVPATVKLKAASAPKATRNPAIPKVPTLTGRLREDQVKRIVVLIVANVSADALRDVKKAMNRFVDEQMQPGDLVSIIRPTEGSGVLQQLTSDKRLLHLAINGVRWNPLGNVSVGAVPDPDSTAESKDEAAMAATRRESASYQDVRSATWLRSLDLIVQGLQDLPGRKSVILFSNGIQLFKKDEQNRRAMEILRRITDRANRGLVTFNTIDARGLQTFGTGASVSGSQLPGVGDSLKSVFDSHQLPASGPGESIIRFVQEQDALVALAEETGGTFAGFNTDISKILGEPQGYYVLGYRPDEESFKTDPEARPFHQIKVNLIRSNLEANFRKGFYGQPDRAPDHSQDLNGQQLLAAFASPFDSSNISLRLTSLYGHDRSEGAFVRSLLHVDARDVTFIAEGEDRLVATLNIYAVAFDQRGPVGEQVRKRYTIRIKKDRFAQLEQEGLVYELTSPVNRSGLCQVRVIVQDAATQQMGLASQLVEIPDLTHGRLTLTGLIVSGKDPSAANLTNNTSVLAADARAAVRRFRVGMEIDYAFLAINAQIDPDNHQSRLSSQVVVYREGQVVYAGPERPLGLTKDVDPQRMIVSGQINLGGQMIPGEYVLQIVVNDALAKEKSDQRVSAWMDFDVVQ